MQENKKRSNTTSRYDDGSAHHCPRCGSSIPAYPHYSAWCDICDWNLQPVASKTVSGQVFKMPPRIGTFFDEYLFKRVLKMRHRLLRLTFLQIIALLSSAIVFGIAGLLFWQSAIFILSENQAQTLGGVILFIILVWSLFPRFDTRPAKRVQTEADEFPMLNRIVRRVASALNTDTPIVMLTEQFTATYARVGIGRHPVLGLGHPFLSILNAKETVSLLAHELSHSQDGAITRSLFVRTALQTARRWKWLASPLLWFRNINPTSFAHYFLLVLSWFLSLFVLPFTILEIVIRFCSYQDSQRAEYVADASSVQVAGTHDTLSLLRKSYYQHLAALRIEYSNAPAHIKFDRLQATLAAIPKREIERVWRIAQRQPTLITGTHPSLQKRIAFLQSLSPQKSLVEITPHEFEALQEELAAWPCVIRKRERNWHEELEQEQQDSCEVVPMPSAAD